MLISWGRRNSFYALSKIWNLRTIIKKILNGWCHTSTSSLWNPFIMRNFQMGFVSASMKSQFKRLPSAAFSVSDKALHAESWICQKSRRDLAFAVS